MDGVLGGSKTVADPEGLLRSALEKIVFFECRVSQLESELAAAHEAAGRARADAGRAERRALQLEQALSGEKGARGDAERRANELHDRVRLLEAERERLLGGLVDRARVAGAAGGSGEPGPEEGGADLAGFISELRAEIEMLRAFRAEAEAAGFQGPASGAAPARYPRAAPGAEEARAAPPDPGLALPPREPPSDDPAPPQQRPNPFTGSPLSPRQRGERDQGRGGYPADTLSTLATRFEATGRVGLTSHDAERMKDVLVTRADRALYDRSLDDLTAPDAGRRVRAVRALEVLGARAAAPVLAQALGREESAEVKTALLAALGRFREPFAAGLAERELADARPAVRVAALEALAAVAAASAEEKLALALSDESPLVRRRAALLLGLQPGERADEALAVALADADRGVARAAAAALSGRPSARAQEALARGLEHPDASVRRAAGNALARVSGESVDSEASPSARRASSRRIAERLAGMQGDEIRNAVLRSAEAAKAPGGRGVAAAPAPATRAAAPVARSAAAPAPTAPGPGPAGAPAPVAQGSPRTAVAVLAAPAAAAGAAQEASSDLEARVVFEIRAALRGCTAEGLAAALGEPAPRIGVALQALLGKNVVAQRGTRWFMS